MTVNNITNYCYLIDFASFANASTFDGEMFLGLLGYRMETQLLDGIPTTICQKLIYEGQNHQKQPRQD